MEQEFIKALSELGAIGAFIFFAGKYGIKALEKLYTDMSNQHKEQLTEAIKREDRLMDFLDQKNETDIKVAATLDNICTEMGCLNRRLEDVENHLGGAGNVRDQKANNQV